MLRKLFVFRAVQFYSFKSDALSIENSVKLLHVGRRLIQDVLSDLHVQRLLLRVVSSAIKDVMLHGVIVEHT